MAGLNSFGVVPYSSFSFFFPEVIRNLELYRLVTGFLVPNPQPMQGLMEVYMLYTFSNGVETKKFSRNLPDYFFYLTITFPVMLFGAYFFLPPVISLSPALMSALTYTWAIANYDRSIVVNGNAPTFAFASVREFNVVDLPQDGLPTIPINGSLGIFNAIARFSNINSKRIARIY